MHRLPYELVFAAITLATITAWYLKAAQGGLPQPGSLTGLALGTAGFLLMLGAETLYTLRKRRQRFASGTMSFWLRMHVFAGIVGPCLALLHSAGKFHGVAGLTAMLTVMIVLSGFVGRFIYTATPRTIEGAELGFQELERQLAAIDRQLKALGGSLRETPLLSLAAATPPRGWWPVFGRHWLRWRHALRLRRTMEHSGLSGQEPAGQVEQLLLQRYCLRLQIGGLAGTRRLLALWHVFHIPLGDVLFILAFIHIGGALYYSVLSK